MTEAELSTMGVGSWILLGIILLFVLYIWYRIFDKAGYSGWLAILMIIPLVNLITLIFFAFTEWPVQKELNALKSSGPPTSPTTTTRTDFKQRE